MRSPLTGVVFALELTHRYEALLPLLIGATAAYAVSILVLRRSVLTEKIARRGLHLTREYSVDPLEVLFVGDVMSTRRRGRWPAAGPAPLVAHADDTLRHVAYAMAEHGGDAAAGGRPRATAAGGSGTVTPRAAAAGPPARPARGAPQRAGRCGPRDLIGFGRGGRSRRRLVG